MTREVWPWLCIVALLVMALGACPDAKAQTFSVTFRPMDLSVSERLIGSRDYGMWSVEVKQLGVEQITRKDILDAGVLDGRLVPFIADDVLARDLIENRVYHSKAAKVGRIISVVSKFAGPALAIAGYATGIDGLSVGGLAISGVQTAQSLAQGREPKPDDVIARLLPQSVTLGYRQAGTFVVLSALVRGARPVGPVEVRDSPVLTPPTLPTGSVFERPTDVWALVAGQ